MTPTFFDSLPHGAKENLLRNLSEEPGALKWQRFVGQYEALSCVHPAHPLVEAAKKTFSKVVSFDADVDDGVAFLDDDAILTWISRAGETLTSLTFGVAEKPVDQALRAAMLLALDSNCTSLRYLDIYAISETLFAIQILRVTGGRLKTLVARGAHTPYIEAHCEGLHELKLADNPSSLNFLKTVGPTLKALDIRGDEGIPSAASSRKLLDLMRVFCPNLTDILIWVDPLEISKYVDLLTSYGERLRSLKIDQFSMEVLERIVRSCPNLKCKNVIEVHPGLGLLGTSVQILSVTVQDASDIERLAEEIEPCSEVEDAVLSVEEEFAADAVKELFRHEKPLLKTLGLTMTDEGFGDKALKELAKGAGSLRSLTYYGDVEDVDVFEKFAEGAPLLEKVVLVQGSGREAADTVLEREQRVVDIVTHFANCPCLRDLEVTIDPDNELKIDQVADVVRRLRIKNARRKNEHGLRVLIEGVDYLD